MNEILQFLKAANTYYLASVDEDGKPHVRPFGTILEIDGKLYVQTEKNKACFKQMDGKPVEITAVAPDGMSWIRLNATLIDDDNHDAKVKMLDAYPMLKKMYSADNPNTAVLYMTDISASIYSYTEKPKKIV